MKWQLHNGFESDFKKIAKKQRGLGDGFEKVKRLLEKHFDPENPQPVIAPGKIHRVSSSSDGNWTLWKIEIMVASLKPNLWPRAWFAVSGDTITFLAINSHNENYDDDAMTKLALDRYDEVS